VPIATREEEADEGNDRIDMFGGPEVLHEAEVDTPEPGAGQVRVRVRTVGVNPFDAKVRSGAMAAVVKNARCPRLSGSRSPHRRRGRVRGERVRCRR